MTCKSGLKIEKAGNKTEKMIKSSEIPSPCVNVCQIDPKSTYCTGCFRTISEIKRWRDASEAERRAICASASERGEKSGIGGLEAV